MPLGREEPPHLRSHVSWTFGLLLPCACRVPTEHLCRAAWAKSVASARGRARSWGAGRHVLGSSSGAGRRGRPVGVGCGCVRKGWALQ